MICALLASMTHSLLDIKWGGSRQLGYLKDIASQTMVLLFVSHKIVVIMQLTQELWCYKFYSCYKLMARTIFGIIPFLQRLILGY
jgi:hypothetical protein